ncbi:MAG: BCCT family transporter [Flavobacteriales bacterium]|nr:BCCT family transporter [Flavobacteriales bacterium]
MKDSKRHIRQYGAVRPLVFWPSLTIIVLFIAFTIAEHKRLKPFFESIQAGICDSAGWFLVLTTNILLIFCVYLATSKYRHIRLGGYRAKPEFSLGAWFAMLFSAGMGIGLLFWSVAEPITHMMHPPIPVSNQMEAAENAMAFTYLHWGLHAWAIYAVMGLALAFFAYNLRLPLNVSSVFHPILGKRVHGLAGGLIDTAAVIATLFGLATSLGLGAKQINSGLNYLLGVEISSTTQVIIIIVVTLMATTSLVLGLKKGIKRLSEFNMYLALIFLVGMILVGPTRFILDTFLENVGGYLQRLPELAFRTEAYENTNWQNSWTLFYWGWWLAWSPFVGMFIARVSKGRTLREFIVGVLAVPSLITFLWMSAFGGSALHLTLFDNVDISGAIQQDVSSALFKFLEHFPYASFTSALGLLLVVSFFVTSSDSGSMVVDRLTTAGKAESPVSIRIFWALTEGAVAAALLLGGGLKALQTASITTGLPLGIAILVMCYCLIKGLQSYHHKTKKHDRRKSTAKKSTDKTGVRKSTRESPKHQQV